MPRSSRDNRGGEVVYAVVTNRAILMPDLRGRSVRDVARTARNWECRLRRTVKGGGIKQSPAAGTELKPGQTDLRRLRKTELKYANCSFASIGRLTEPRKPSGSHRPDDPPRHGSQQIFGNP